MSILFRCGECDAETDVDDDLAGKRILCRKCDSPGMVSKRSPIWSPRKRWFWITAAFIFALIAVPTVGFALRFSFLWIERENLRTPQQTDRNALLLASEGEWKKAFQVIDAAITEEPARPSHWMTRAKLYMEYGNYRKAASDCQTVLRLDPDYADAKEMLSAARAIAEDQWKASRREELTSELESTREQPRCGRLLLQKMNGSRGYLGVELNGTT